MPSSAAALPFDTAPPGWRLPAPGTLVAERYELGEVLGEGGMSAVFSAYDRRLRRKVAFKLMSPRLAHSPDVVTRFVNEARTLARLDCPFIVQVFDAGITGEPGGTSLPYMVLEYLRGAELRSVADSGGYDDERVIGWMLEACEGLAAAHGEGIIHRDLKPENLFLVVEPDGSERIKILDFGIARSMQADWSLTLEGEGVGSPGYMSPEQLRDASTVDQRSDIWSLGVVMYELFGREPPFHAQSPLELCSMILNAPIRPLGELRPDLHPDLAAIVDRCLEREPELRFPNVLELAEALVPFARPSGLLATTRIRRRLQGLTLLDDQESTDSDVTSDEDRASPVVPSSIRRKKQVRRMWLARSLGVVLLMGVLSLLAVAFVPGAAVRARALAAKAFQNISPSVTQTLDRLLNRH